MARTGDGENCRRSFGNGSYFKHYTLRMMHDFVEPQMLYEPKNKRVRAIYAMCYVHYTVLLTILPYCYMYIVYVYAYCFYQIVLQDQSTSIGSAHCHVVCGIVFNQTETAISHSYINNSAQYSVVFTSQSKSHICHRLILNVCTYLFICAGYAHKPTLVFDRNIFDGMQLNSKNLND